MCGRVTVCLLTTLVAAGAVSFAQGAPAQAAPAIAQTQGTALVPPAGKGAVLHVYMTAMGGLPAALIYCDDEPLAVIPGGFLFRKNKLSATLELPAGKHVLWAAGHSKTADRVEIDMAAGEEYYVKVDTTNSGGPGYKTRIVPPGEAAKDVAGTKSLTPPLSSLGAPSATGSAESLGQPQAASTSSPTLAAGQSVLPTRPRSAFTALAIGAFAFEPQPNESPDTRVSKAHAAAKLRGALWDRLSREGKLQMPVWLADERSVLPPGAAELTGLVLSESKGNDWVQILSDGFGGKREVALELTLRDGRNGEVVYRQQLRGKSGGVEATALQFIATDFCKALLDAWR